MDRNYTTGYGDWHQLFDANSLNAQFDLASTRSAQPFHHFVLRYFDSGYHRVIDFDDTVTSQYTGFCTGTGVNHIEYDYRIGGHVEHYANAIEFAVERFVHSCHIFGWDIDRMGIEFIENQGNCLFRDGVERDGIHITIGD